MTKKTLTSFDVAAIVLELKEKLEGARIQNIYQIERGYESIASRLKALGARIERSNGNAKA